MQYMVLTRRTDGFSDGDYTPERLEGEAEAVRRLYSEGIVRQIWHRGDIGGACMLMEGTSDAEIRASLQTLPLFAAGVQEAVWIVPLRPYRGFGPRQ